MSTALHQASVPVFLHYLDRLTGLLDTAEKQASERGIVASDLLSSRLAPDMLPFSTQVEIAANFALRACFPLAGLPLPPYGEFPATFAGLRARIAHVVGLLHSLDPAAFAGAESRLHESKAGNALVSLKGAEFLSLYTLPNFFFHLTTAYAILRNQGLAVGKEQFDGFHDYRTS